MTSVPNDQIDPYESRLARRVGAFTEQAILPFDATAIAATVALDARRRSGVIGRLFRSPGAGARLALIGAGAALVVAGAVVFGGGGNGVVPPVQTPTSAPVALRDCTPDDVDAVITAWDGAAGHRIATVELHQIGSSACAVASLPQPWLADGNGSPMINGKAGAGAPISIAPGEVLHTLVDVSNYCGPDPKAPVTLAFTEVNTATFVATALTRDDLSGVPPCNGPGSPATIQMHPWGRQIN